MNALRFDNRVAIITGAGQAGGMGEAHATWLADRGATVFVTDRAHRRESPAHRLAATISARGGTAAALDADLSDPTAGAQIANEAISRYGRLDIVINNAGTLAAAQFPQDDTLVNLEHAFAINVAGPFNLIRAAWPYLVAQRYGRIVNVSSSAILGSAADMSYATGVPGNLGATYSTTKAAIVGLTRTLANHGADHGIKVNAVAPVAATEMAPRSATRLRNGEERPLEPSLVSAGMVVLVHEDCPVSGELLGIGGGKVDRLFLGATQGYLDVDLTPERLLANWGQVMDREDYWVPEDAKAHADRLRQDRGSLLDSE